MDQYSNATQESRGIGSRQFGSQIGGRAECEVPPLPSRPPMEVAFGELVDQRSRLEELITQLRQRLNTVIPNVPESEGKDSPKQLRCASELVTGIQRESTLLESCNRRLFAILRDIEI